ncbi:MAG: hemerythrin domain-containing protein [Mycobacteriales bacterium]
MADIVDLIKAQHRQVDKLIKDAEGKAEQGESRAIPALLQQAADLLLPHSQAEESFVYPRIAELDRSERDEVHDGAAEHHHVEELLRELLAEDPEAAGYDGKLAAMAGELRHHVEEEEQELLPVLSENCPDEERAEMADRFAAATGSGAVRPDPGGSADPSRATRAELYEMAKEQDVSGRSKMSKEELAEAVDPRPSR